MKIIKYVSPKMLDLYYGGGATDVGGLISKSSNEILLSSKDRQSDMCVPIEINIPEKNGEE